MPVILMEKKINRERMKKGLWVWVFVCTGLMLYGQSRQDTLHGVVTYKTTLNVYIKFPSTSQITIGDTLYRDQQGKAQPVVIVRQLSSTSCVGNLIQGVNLKISDQVMSIHPLPDVPTEVATKPSLIYESIINADQQPIQDTIIPNPKSNKIEPAFRGRISAASYINFANQPGYDVQRMRYTFTLRSKLPQEKGFGMETYMTFRHTINEWQDVKENFLKAMKIYTLAIQYNLNKTTRFWLGRKINFNISNLGAIDGIQAEKQWNHIIVGSFFGSRPDNLDYGINLNLVQYGAYVSYVNQNKKGQISNTLSIAEQRNHHMTDRRFLYFQHQNSTIRNINIFASAEIDLYTIKNNQPQNTFLLSSLYTSIRYRVSRKLSVSMSYDARKNIIYYETYKSFIDQLLEDEMRQGLRGSFNLRPLKKITLGASAGYRFERNNSHPAQNINAYLTCSQITSLRISTTLSAVLLQTSYLNGNIYGIRLSKDFMKGRLYEEVEFRTVEYRYGNTELPIQQQIIGVNTTLRLNKKLSLSVNYEGELQTNRTFNRIYSNVVYRL